MKLTILDSHLRSDYIDKYAVGDVFVETGAWLGDNAELVRQQGRFVKIHSVESNKERFEYCRTRFEEKPLIQMWHGESAETLRFILKLIDNPATFWLDSPAGSKGHPVLDELVELAGHSIRNHTIFIDDRRLFASEEWGAQITEDKAMALLREINPGYQINYLDGEIENDIIVASLVGE